MGEELTLSARAITTIEVPDMIEAKIIEPQTLAPYIPTQTKTGNEGVFAFHMDKPLISCCKTPTSEEIKEKARQNKMKWNLPERYIINEYVCVCCWSNGTTTKSFKHKEDRFNKKLGFLLSCFRHYYSNLSKNKQKKIISWIKYESLEDCLFDIFIERTGMTVRQAQAYLNSLKVEQPKKQKQRKPKHMKEEGGQNEQVR